MHYHVYLTTFYNINITLLCLLLVVGLGAVQAYYLGKTDFELAVGGEGQDTSRHFEGGFGSPFFGFWA